MAGMRLEVFKWFACRHVVLMLSQDIESFKKHMVMWLDMMQAVAVSACITYR